MRAEIVYQPSAALVRLLKDWQPPEINRAFADFLLQAAYRVQRNAASKQIRRGGRIRVGSRLVDSPPLPSKLTSRTGELRRSIAVDRSRVRAKLPEVSVGTDLVYGFVHETGGRHGRGFYPKRAFLEPALRQESRGFESLLRRTLVRHLRL